MGEWEFLSAPPWGQTAVGDTLIANSCPAEVFNLRVWGGLERCWPLDSVHTLGCSPTTDKITCWSLTLTVINSQYNVLTQSEPLAFK